MHIHICFTISLAVTHSLTIAGVMEADTVSRQDNPSKGSNVKDSNNNPEWNIRLHFNSRIVDFRENGIDIFVDVMYNWMCDQASSNPNTVSIRMNRCFTQLPSK